MAAVETPSRELPFWQYVRAQQIAAAEKTEHINVGNAEDSDILQEIVGYLVRETRSLLCRDQQGEPRK